MNGEPVENRLARLLGEVAKAEIPADHPVLPLFERAGRLETTTRRRIVVPLAVGFAAAAVVVLALSQLGSRPITVATTPIPASGAGAVRLGQGHVWPDSDAPGHEFHDPKSLGVAFATEVLGLTAPEVSSPPDAGRGPTTVDIRLSAGPGPLTVLAVPDQAGVWVLTQVGGGTSGLGFPDGRVTLGFLVAAGADHAALYVRTATGTRTASLGQGDMERGSVAVDVVPQSVLLVFFDASGRVVGAGGTHY